MAIQFNSHKNSSEALFQLAIHGWVLKVICQLEKEPLKGLANVQEVFSKTISLVIDLQ